MPDAEHQTRRDAGCGVVAARKPVMELCAKMEVSTNHGDKIPSLRVLSVQLALYTDIIQFVTVSSVP